MSFLLDIIHPLTGLPSPSTGLLKKSRLMTKLPLSMMKPIVDAPYPNVNQNHCLFYELVQPKGHQEISW